MPGITVGNTLPVANPPDEQVRNYLYSAALGLGGIADLQNARSTALNANVANQKWLGTLSSVPALQEALNIKDPGLALLYGLNFSPSAYQDAAKVMRTQKAVDEFSNFQREGENTQLPVKEPINTTNLPGPLVSEAQRIPAQEPFPEGFSLRSITKPAPFIPQTFSDLTAIPPSLANLGSKLQEQEPISLPQNLVEGLSATKRSLPQATQEANKKLQLFLDFSKVNPQAGNTLVESGYFDQLKSLSQLGKEEVQVGKETLELAGKEKTESILDKPVDKEGVTIREAQQRKQAIIPTPDITEQDRKTVRENVINEYPELSKLFSQATVFSQARSPQQQQLFSKVNKWLDQRILINKDSSLSSEEKKQRLQTVESNIQRLIDIAKTNNILGEELER